MISHSILYIWLCQLIFPFVWAKLHHDTQTCTQSSTCRVKHAHIHANKLASRHTIRQAGTESGRRRAIHTESGVTDTQPDIQTDKYTARHAHTHSGILSCR